MLRSSVGWAAFALAVLFVFDVLEAQPTERDPTVTQSVIPATIPTGEIPLVKGEVPQAILDAILKQIAGSASVGRDQVMIERAESVVWNDGSLGCPEPGMAYTQALVKGYWVVAEAAGKKYDFRVGSGGTFRLCPPGQGQPPSQSAAN
jgi:hypothetical protein